eukprot:TRINITY_DN2822_c0_g1_i1.p1 TRINITY_DN2822_c0_g1~~TRINITY_DN2822_c0_g1_i1.p1  ORF type:complete len:243 (-),score=33.11 TRINITY_DN2822_c0_g1_i1:302-1030(-)
MQSGDRKELERWCDAVDETSPLQCVEWLADIADVSSKNSDCLRASLGGLHRMARRADARQYIAVPRIMHTILSAMKAYPSHELIQSNALGALTNMTAQSDYQEAMEHAFFADNGLDPLLNAMKGYPRNVDIQSRSCGTLCNLSCNLNTAAVLVSSGAITLLASAMRTHPESADVQYAGCSAIFNLAGDPDTDYYLPLARDCTDVVRAAQLATSDARVEQIATRVLRRLQDAELAPASSCTVQ